MQFSAQKDTLLLPWSHSPSIPEPLMTAPFTPMFHFFIVWSQTFLLWGYTMRPVKHGPRSLYLHWFIHDITDLQLFSSKKLKSMYVSFSEYNITKCCRSCIIWYAKNLLTKLGKYLATELWKKLMRTDSFNGHLQSSLF
jgi:hypothetical protein